MWKKTLITELMEIQWESNNPNTNTLLSESLCYDNAFPQYLLEQPTERERIVHEKKYFLEMEKELFTLSELLQEKNIQSFSLLLKENWKKIYGISSNNITFEIPIEENFEASLKLWIKIFWSILYKKPFLKWNHTRWILLFNMILSHLGLPWIILYHKDRKRILREIDHYIDFEKEIMLTIISSYRKNLYEKNFPEAILKVEEYRIASWKSSVYIKPWYWWRWDDRQKYMILAN